MRARCAMSPPPAVWTCAPVCQGAGGPPLRSVGAIFELDSPGGVGSRGDRQDGRRVHAGQIGAEGHQCPVEGRAKTTAVHIELVLACDPKSRSGGPEPL